MSQSAIYRAKRNEIAEWLRDNFGEDDQLYAAFWPDAASLIKHLKANGWEIRPTRGQR